MMSEITRFFDLSANETTENYEHEIKINGTDSLHNKKRVFIHPT